MQRLCRAADSTAGTPSVFRAACQFGGGDAAATLADLANRVMFGEAGVDYGKSNPNSIGVWYPITADLNNGVAALVAFDTPLYAAAFTYEEVLAQPNLLTYWDSVSGYNKDAQDPGAPLDAPAAGIEGGRAYTAIMQGIGGDEAHEFDLMDDGTCLFFLPGNTMITDKYQGRWTLAEDGVTVSIEGLTNVDTSSAFRIPGLWPYIDAGSGNATIVIDPDAGTFTAR